jgi:hypothetical protein
MKDDRLVGRAAVMENSENHKNIGKNEKEENFEAERACITLKSILQEQGVAM